MRIFYSKVDPEHLFWSLFTVFVAIAGALFVVSSGTRFGVLLATIILIVGSGLPLWFLFSTYYVIADGMLRIRSGPLTWSIPISTIIEVRETRCPITSPALSLERLELVYEDQRLLLVSPKQKLEFMRAIQSFASRL